MFRKLWASFSNLFTAFSMWQLWSAAVIAVMSSTVAWLRGYDPISLFLVGLAVFALLVFILERVATWNYNRKRASKPEAAKNQEPIPWKDWRPDDQFRAKLDSLCGEHSNVEITYYHGPDFKFSERIADQLDLAGWDVNFNKHAFPQGSPIYHGITVQGPSRTLVEGVSGALRESGIRTVSESITPFNTPKEHHKYETGRNGIRIFVGYEE